MSNTAKKNGRPKPSPAPKSGSKQARINELKCAVFDSMQESERLKNLFDLELQKRQSLLQALAQLESYSLTPDT